MDSGETLNGLSNEPRMEFGAHVVHKDGEKRVSGSHYAASFGSSKDDYDSRYSSYNSLEQARMNAHLDRINHLPFDVCPDVDDEMASKEKRLETFKLWPKSSPIKPVDLAMAGFYFTGTGDEVRCFSCDLQLKGWVTGDNPFDDHKRLEPNCIFILETERESYAVTCHGEPVSCEITSENIPFRQMPTTRPYLGLDIKYKYEDQHVSPYTTSGNTEHNEPRFPSTLPYVSSISPSILAEQYRSLQQRQEAYDKCYPQNQSLVQEAPPFRSEQFISSAGTSLPFYNPQQTGYPPVNYQYPSAVTSQPMYPQLKQPYLRTPSQFSSRIRSVEPRTSQPGYMRNANIFDHTCSTVGSVSQESMRPAPENHPYLQNFDIPVLHPMPNQGPHVRTEDTLHITSPTDLQSEHHRMTTFVDWPEDCPVRPWELASAGFYYLGNADNVKCYKCGVALRNWEPQDTPWEEHKRWSPDCLLVKEHYQGKHAHGPVEDQEQAHARLTITSQAKKQNLSKPTQAQRLRFQFQGRDQTYHNQARDQTYPNQTGDQTYPNQTRFQTYPNQARDQTYPNQARDQTYPNQARDKESTQQRLPYKAFPRPSGVKEPFSSQGKNQRYPAAFYRGQENMSTSNEHIPEAASTAYRLAGVRKEEYPSQNESGRPLLLSRALNEEAVTMARSQTTEYSSTIRSPQAAPSSPLHSSTEVPSSQDTSLENEGNLSTRDVMMAIEMGFTREAIDEAIARKTQRTGIGFSKLDELMQALLDSQNSVTTTPQITSTNTSGTCTTNSDPELSTGNEGNQNQREQAQMNFALVHSISYHHQDQIPGPKQALKRSNSAPPGSSTSSGTPNETARELERMQEERLICKICMDAEVGIVFLPCGHISCCPNCASGLDLCPMCRMSIQRMHRTFLS